MSRYSETHFRSSEDVGGFETPQRFPSASSTTLSGAVSASGFELTTKELTLAVALILALLCDCAERLGLCRDCTSATGRRLNSEGVPSGEVKGDELADDLAGNP